MHEQKLILTGIYITGKNASLGAEGFYMQTANLTALKQYDKIKKQALYKSDPFEVIFLTIAKDELLKPHTSKTDAFLVVIEGDIIFTLEGIDFTLHKDDLFQFKANQLHSVKALTDASLLLIK